ncbi:hypothetical protein BDF20DRAFT_986523 [Mycotypha africana]|uniref:uncharacterized protein n=1 Tax=Mycotypha africana TaxID=64632 RepID=UPI0023014D66|nr:uncharacterized protein BDF20DRAFT_986523 [Mycotypha africana]KAI8984672.1 hypothetical protein BDF20DRAFT_986523 [Mycotypha africana]
MLQQRVLPYDWKHQIFSTLGKKNSRLHQADETEIPTAKTGYPQQYDNHIRYILQHIEPLFSFYGAGAAEDRFRLCQGRQRAADNMVDMLLDGTSNYNEDLRARKRGSRKKKKKKETTTRKWRRT